MSSLTSVQLPVDIAWIRCLPSLPTLKRLQLLPCAVFQPRTLRDEEASTNILADVLRNCGRLEEFLTTHPLSMERVMDRGIALPKRLRLLRIQSDFSFDADFSRASFIQPSHFVRSSSALALSLTCVH
jgi:hypothetical protein